MRGIFTRRRRSLDMPLSKPNKEVRPQDGPHLLQDGLCGHDGYDKRQIQVRLKALVGKIGYIRRRTEGFFIQSQVGRRLSSIESTEWSDKAFLWIHATFHDE